MATMLFEFENRDEAHAKAEEIRGEYPRAECREDYNQPKPFQVWDEADPIRQSQRG